MKDVFNAERWLRHNETSHVPYNNIASPGRDEPRSLQQLRFAGTGQATFPTTILRYQPILFVPQFSVLKIPFSSLKSGFFFKRTRLTLQPAWFFLIFSHVPKSQHAGHIPALFEHQGQVDHLERFDHNGHKRVITPLTL